MKNKKIIIEGYENINKFFDENGMSSLKDGIDIECVDKFNKSKKTPKGFVSKAKEDDRICRGYATTPTVDWVDDSVTLEAMQDAKDDLMRKGTNTVFFNHDLNMPIGKVISTMVNDVGMFIEVLISKAKDVEDIWTKIKEGILQSYSIRFKPKKVEVEKDDHGNMVAFKILKMDLLEVSVVGLPMNKDANITEVLGKSFNTVKSSKKGDLKMSKENQKKSDKGETLTEIVQEVVGEVMGEYSKKMDDLTAIVKSLVPAEKKETKVEEKKTEETKTEQPDAIKTLTDTVNALKATVDGLATKKEEQKKSDEEKATKKSAETEDEAKKVEIVKSLKSLDDEMTCMFVLKAMNDTETYNALTNEEKSKCKNLYFQMAKHEKVF